jgi:uncharacterized phiE125 gp8 family phage protein
MIVSVQELMAHLGVPEDDQDQLPIIAGFSRVAEDWLDGPDGVLRRSLTIKTLELTTDRFPDRYCAIRLPLPPLRSVLSVTYVDENGDDQLLDPAVYHVVGAGIAGPGCILLAHDQTWPSTRRQRDGIRIVYTAGHDSFAPVPEALRHSLILAVQGLYDCGAIPDAAWHLARPFQVQDL